MRAAAVCIAFILTCMSGSFVAGIRFMDPISSQPGSNGDIGDKRVDLIEPSCDELRAMWRYTKRQNRAAKTTNDYPIYPPNPFYQAVWTYPDRTKSSMVYRARYADAKYAARPRSRAAGGAPIYGRMVHKAPPGSRLRNGMRQRARTFDDMRLFGLVNRYTPSNRHLGGSFRFGGGATASKVPQSGSFEALKNIIQAERARELQKQHIEEMGAKASSPALKKMMEKEQEPNIQQSQQRFANLTPPLQLTPESKYYTQHRYMTNIPNIGQAWSRSGPLSHEYLIR